MAIFNNSGLFANPFEKTKSVSGSKNVQNPFGDQKIPNYMELFQFNDATKPIDFVELKDDKSSDKKSSNSTELTMEEDVSVKDKLSWEKILGVEWKRGKDTSVTQKDGEKIFESTVKNVVSGEERKIKTVIHKDKETCSTYMSVNGTPEGNPYSKLIQELKGMGESETAETANSTAGAAGAPQNRDGNANVTEKSETPGTSAATGTDTNTQNQQALTEITYEARGNKYSVAINPLPSSLEENWTPGSAKEWIPLENNVWKHLEFDNNNNLIGRVFELVKTETGTDFKFLETYAPKNNNTANTDSAGTIEKVGDLQITYNALPSGYDPNYQPGEGWEKREYIQEIDGQDKKVVTYKNTENGLYFKVVADKTNNTTKFIRDTQTFNLSNLEKPIKADKFVAPDLGPNYKFENSDVQTNGSTPGGYDYTNISKILKYKRIDGEYFTVRYSFSNGNYIWDGQAPQKVTK